MGLSLAPLRGTQEDPHVNHLASSPVRSSNVSKAQRLHLYSNRFIITLQDTMKLYRSAPPNDGQGRKVWVPPRAHPVVSFGFGGKLHLLPGTAKGFDVNTPVLKLQAIPKRKIRIRGPLRMLKSKKRFSNRQEHAILPGWPYPG